MKLIHLFLLVLFASMPLLAVVRASDDEASEDSSSEQQESYEDATQEDEGGEFGQSPDVVTAFHFPADPAHRRFAAGQPITLLIGFKNNGDQYFNVSSVGGHLLSPYDAKFGIQNYSRREYHVVVSPGREGTFEYVFRPHESLEGNDYPFVADIVYFSSKKVYRNVVFNHTIELTEQTNFLNSLGVGSWFVWAGVAGVVYIFFFANKSGKSKSTSSTKASTPKASAKVETGTGSSSIENEWTGKKYDPSAASPGKKKHA